MKKLAILGFALITAFLAACSDDSSSSKEGVVSCTLKSTLDGTKISSVCWQMPDAYKDSMEKLCENLSALSQKDGVVTDEECETSHVQKECVASDNFASVLYYYDRIMSRTSCAKTFEMFSSIGEGEVNEEETEEGDVFHVIYNVPEQRCVQYNALYQPKSDLENLYGEVHIGLELTQGTGIYELENDMGCGDIVLKTPVVTCSDGDDVNSVTVFFYDKNLAGKKCKDLVSFVPATVDESELEEVAEAEDESEAEEE